MIHAMIGAYKQARWSGALWTEHQRSHHAIPFEDCCWCAPGMRIESLLEHAEYVDNLLRAASAQPINRKPGLAFIRSNISRSRSALSQIVKLIKELHEEATK